MMTIKQEKELEDKGYRIDISPNSHSDAKELANQYRAKGYFARIGEYSTRIPGLHNYAVWYKLKN